MEINVTGFAEIEVTPNQTEIWFSISRTELTKELALKNGKILVQNLLTELNNLNIKKEEVITRSISVREEFEYVNNQRKRKGFSYNQYATLTIDYNLALLSKIINLTTTLPGISTNTTWQIKKEDASRYENELFKLAFINAKEQAQTLAKISGKQLEDCVKLSTTPLANEPLPFREGLAKTSAMSLNSPNLEEIVTPQNITLSKTLFTLWLTK